MKNNHKSFYFLSFKRDFIERIYDINMLCTFIYSSRVRLEKPVFYFKLKSILNLEFKT